jgi:hypothetical protein
LPAPAGPTRMAICSPPETSPVRPCGCASLGRAPTEAADESGTHVTPLAGTTCSRPTTVNLRNGDLGLAPFRFPWRHHGARLRICPAFRSKTCLVRSMRNSAGVRPTKENRSRNIFLGDSWKRRGDQASMICWHGQEGEAAADYHYRSPAKRFARTGKQVDHRRRISDSDCAS